jgi:D-arabinose 1-dehydrogenase-like Zn-dependent alcohol dehydrogenase
MAETMKAAVLESVKVVRIKEVPVPEIGAGEVLVKVKNTGICGTDWSIYNGWYSADKLPMIPGHEFSGVIAKVGRDGNGLKEGDRVTADINMSCGHCYYCIRGQQLLCNNFTQLGIHTNGTYAEYVKAQASLVHHLPDNLSFEEGLSSSPSRVASMPPRP